VKLLAPTIAASLLTDATLSLLELHTKKAHKLSDAAILEVVEIAPNDMMALVGTHLFQTVLNSDLKNFQYKMKVVISSSILEPKSTGCNSHLNEFLPEILNDTILFSHITVTGQTDALRIESVYYIFFN
jgi:hypothetical protein